MKVKKVLNQKLDPMVVQMTDPHNKNNDINNVLAPLSPPLPESPNALRIGDQYSQHIESQPNDETTDETIPESEDPFDKMPGLKDLPHFYSIESIGDELSFLSMPELKPLPDFLSYQTIYSNNTSNETNIAFKDQMTDKSVDNNVVYNSSDDQIFDSSVVSDLDRIIGEMPEILEDINEDILSQIQVSPLIPNQTVNVTQDFDINPKFTQMRATNVSNNSNSDHNFVKNIENCVNRKNDSLNESMIDLNLSDLTNSPLTPPKTATSSSEQIPTVSSNFTNTYIQRTVTFSQSKPNQNQLNNVISKNCWEQPLKRSPLKIKQITKPFQYCAHNYRYFNLTRHSGRHKNSSQSDEYDYDNSLLNFDWNQIDGTLYEAKVIKWSDENMDEEKRKQILRTVEQMNFVKSVYDSDKNVFYCWTAFKGQLVEGTQPINRDLKCLMRLDPPAVKYSRFVKYQTRLFLLSGQSAVNVENGKQRKNIEVGQELVIPPHTRYELESKGVETSYFYVIISNK